MSTPFEKYQPTKPVVPFTLERKQQFIQMFRYDPDLGGRKNLCAEAVGVSTTTIDYHRKKDPLFSEAYEEALQGWIDENLFTPALIRARDGVEKPVIGGKFKDQIICHIREYSDSLTLALLRAHRSEFREGGGAAGAGGGNQGGVMIVPSAPISMDEWQKTYGEMAKGTSGKPEGEA